MKAIFALSVLYIFVTFIVGFIDNYGEPVVLGFFAFRKLKKRGKIKDICYGEIECIVDGMTYYVYPHWSWYPYFILMCFFNNINPELLKVD